MSWAVLPGVCQQSMSGVHSQFLPTSLPGLLPLLCPAPFFTQAWADVVDLAFDSN